MHMRTQDFTLEGVHVVGARPGVWGTEVPSGVHRQSPGREPGGRGLPEADTKCEICVQFLTFSCRKFRT